MNSFTAFSKKILLVFVFGLLIPGVAFASQTNGTIVSGGNAGYAWSNQAGWVNFGATNGNIHITDSGITGYAWNSNYGWINMNPNNGGVHVSANGSLSGYAWGQGLGWVNFSGASITSAGKFSGQATGATIGTLTFACTNCNVATDYRPKDYRTATTNTQTPSGSISPISAVASTAIPPAVTTSEPTTTPPEIPAQKRNNNNGSSIINKANLANTSQGIANSQYQTNTLTTHLSLNKTTVTTVKNLVANVVFNSSKQTPTHVLMTFSILADNGNVVWSNEATTTVRTQLVYTKHFSNTPKLSAGSYTLKLYTRYNGKASRLLAERFTIEPQATPTPTARVFWLIDGLELLLIAFLIFLVIKRWRGNK